MKLSPLLAVGVLSAGCLAVTIPANAQPTARVGNDIATRTTVMDPTNRVQSRMMQSPAAAAERPITMNDIRQSQPLGQATVTSVQGSTLGVRLDSGRTAQITMFGPGPVVPPGIRPPFGPGPRVIPHTIIPGTRLELFVRQNGSLIFLTKETDTTSPTR
jgi:hypothetical protein